jgi:hypothetical protein
MKIKKAMFRKIAFAFVTTAAILFQGCLSDDSKPDEAPTAFVSMYHASPDTPDLDIHVDNRKVNQYDFAYSNFTGYRFLYTGVRNIRFTPPNGTTFLLDTNVTLLKDKIYSLFLVNTKNNLEAIFVGDSLKVPAENKVRVRFAHLSPDAPALDATISGSTTPLQTNLIFKNITEFIEIPAGKQTIVFKQAGGEAGILTLPDATLNVGENYTIVIRGFQTPPSGNINTLSGQVLLND